MRARRGCQFLICLIPLLIVLSTITAQAQDHVEGWSQPFRLSSREGEASEGFIVADMFGHVHVFWAEMGFAHQRSLIYYARFDGASWSTPVDIYASWPGIAINSLSPSFDLDGHLHLLWTEGNSGPVFYTRALIDEALSARGWSDPIRIDIPARKISLLVDFEGVIHILYINTIGPEPGIYFTRSVSYGKSWTYPVRIDTDIPTNATPVWFDFELGEDSSLHASWAYADHTTASFMGRWVRYSHSLDGGETWSEPYLIDIADNESDELRMANPGLIVQGKTVHVIWGGKDLSWGRPNVNRRHRFSLDLGKTWGDVSPIFEGLEGQSGGDGLAVDTANRVHFVGALRVPDGIYHAIYNNENWSDPELIYQIRGDAFSSFEGTVNAHNVRLAIRAGNQLIMIFTTAPGDPQSVLYEMHHTLSDTEPAPVLTVSSPTPVFKPSSTPIEVAVTSEPSSLNLYSAVPMAKPMGRGKILALTVTLVGLFVFGVFITRNVLRRR